MTMPSSSTSFSMPNRDKPSAIDAIRSLSLTRSSSAPHSTVRPVAQAAATNKTGNSSIASGTRSSGISIPTKAEDLTRRSATGSPPTSRSLSTSMSAPMSVKIVITPDRVGFIPTCSSVRSEPGAIEAATRKNAADEMSAGISNVAAVRRPPPCTLITSFSRSTS